MLAQLTTNRASTDGSNYPDIHPIGFDLPADDVFAAIERVAAASGWKQIESDPEARELVAQSVTRLFKFVDDVRIWVTDGDDDDGANESDRTRVHASSKSRVGKADFGTNARRLRTFFDELRAELGR